MLLITIITVLIWLAGDKDSDQIVKEVAMMSAAAVGRIEDFNYTRTNAGRTEWEVQAKTAELFQEKNLAVFTDGKLTFYTEDDRILNLSGRQGRLHTDSYNVEIEGSIVANSDDGYRLLTNSFSYNAKAKEVTTKDPVILFGDQLSVNGTGLHIDVERQYISLSGPVTARVWNLYGPPKTEPEDRP